MPSRYLREAYITSERIDAASSDSRDLFVRLLLVADDYGRFFADPRIISSKCFPLSASARKCPHSADKCAQLLAECVKVGLVQVYEADGKRFLQINQWHERVRSKSKYPAPPDLSDNCQQPAGSCQQPADKCQPPTPYALRPTITPTPSAPSEISLDADGWGGILEADRKAWAAAYPAISVETEIAKARAWAMANPKNTKSNWRRFLVNWMGRAQERAPARGNGVAQPKRVAL